VLEEEDEEDDNKAVTLFERGEQIDRLDQSDKHNEEVRKQAIDKGKIEFTKEYFDELNRIYEMSKKRPQIE